MWKNTDQNNSEYGHFSRSESECAFYAKRLFFGTMMYMFLSQETCFDLKKKPLSFSWFLSLLPILFKRFTLLWKFCFQLCSSCWKVFQPSLFLDIRVILTVSLSTGSYLFKINNGSTRPMCKVCPKLTRKTPESHCVKSIQIRSFSVPYFSVFGPEKTSLFSDFYI